MTETIKYISDNLSEAEKWGQLAEECTELAQAALKMQRLCSDKNQPRKTKEDCIDSVIEEHADVCGCFAVLGWDDKRERDLIMESKLNRWANLIATRVLEGLKGEKNGITFSR